MKGKKQEKKSREKMKAKKKKKQRKAIQMFTKEKKVRVDWDLK